MVMDLTDSSSWQDAVERFPRHTSREVLSQFLSVSSVPKSLQHFCQMLRKAEARAEEADLHKGSQHLGQDVTIRFHVVADDATFTFEGVKEVAPDFSECNLGILRMPNQPGPIDFLCPGKCGIFGVCCEGIPKQVNFVVDERMASSKGSNAVLSYSHHFFSNFGLSEEDVELYCDNDSGQNKNNLVMSFKSSLKWKMYMYTV